MSNTISGQPSGAPLVGTEVYPIMQTGNKRNCQTSDIATYAVAQAIDPSAPRGLNKIPVFNASGLLTDGVLEADTTGVRFGDAPLLQSSDVSVVSMLYLVQIQALTVDGELTMINQTDGTSTHAGTLTNAPAVGNPTYWLKVKINGTDRYIPAW